MFNLRIISILHILFSVSAVFSQNENDVQIDSISLKLFCAFQMNSFEDMNFYLAKHEDMDYSLNQLKAKMSEEEFTENLKRADSICQIERANWIEQFRKIRNVMEMLAIDWKTANYLSSDIEYKVEEMFQLTMAKVHVLFKSGDRNFNIEYGLVKMPRGWVLRTKLYFNEITKND